ncbi:MAG: LuxR C-terminal-related transcriptional regulator [Solirubrobacteraceae bacterium]
MATHRPGASVSAGPPRRTHATRGRGAPADRLAGLSNTEIADKLVLSSATVKTHINRIFYKTGARDRAQAVRYAYQHGLA